MKINAGNITCAKHKTDFIDYKCRYCCDLALWFCFGTTHFCDKCHRNPYDTAPKVCKGPEKCPLKGNHAKNGEEYALGCSLCREECTKELIKE